MHKEFTILQDIVVHSVPDGVRTTLEKGKTGIISQSLGDNYTIVVEGNMYQVSGIDGEKIGEEKRDISSNNFASEEEIWNVLHTCYDPEIPVNIVDLGLIYDVDINGSDVDVKMTLTAAGCGMGPYIAQQAEWAISELEDVEDVNVDIVFDPPWDPERITEDGKKLLGID